MRLQAVRPVEAVYDFEREYDFIYSQMSDYTHSGPVIFHIFSPSGGFDPEVCRPSRSAKLTVPWSVTDWLLQIIGFASRALEIEFDGEIAASQQRAMTLIRDQSAKSK